ncbi:hypothetical protein J6590_018852 [Homalodisca vitripennis]|nr:hypothetical protein J6590_018852 [Homalodisca vitripennis]
MISTRFPFCWRVRPPAPGGRGPVYTDCNYRTTPVLAMAAIWLGVAAEHYAQNSTNSESASRVSSWGESGTTFPFARGLGRDEDVLSRSSSAARGPATGHLEASADQEVL